MLKDFKFSLLGQNLFLHPYKSMYWLERKILLLADIHYGKAAHFRKSGIAIPESIHKQDLERLAFLYESYLPERIIFLGDLFHSQYNETWKKFQFFCERVMPYKPELVLGNHDILDKKNYDFLEIHESNLCIDPFIFTHIPLINQEPGGLYNICGHLHPAVKISGSAKQSLALECFYFSKNHGILPAFGSFTGSSLMRGRKSEDEIFAITNQKIIRLT
jgi:DNA ligase-associated metallophosphoesterase